jgi:hypothetical protein
VTQAAAPVDVLGVPAPTAPGRRVRGCAQAVRTDPASRSSAVRIERHQVDGAVVRRRSRTSRTGSGDRSGPCRRPAGWPPANGSRQPTSSSDTWAPCPSRRPASTPRSTSTSLPWPATPAAGAGTSGSSPPTCPNGSLTLTNPSRHRPVPPDGAPRRPRPRRHSWCGAPVECERSRGRGGAEDPGVAGVQPVRDACPGFRGGVRRAGRAERRASRSGAG